MPEESVNQPQTIDDLILSILAEEAQIISCLRILFCKTLQEISTGYLSPERKVLLAKDLINAAAQKEAALATVLEAISKIIDEEPEEWIILAPGASFQVTSISPTIQTVTFKAKTDDGCTGQIIAVCYKDVLLADTTDIAPTPSVLSLDIWAPGDTQFVTLKNIGNCTIFIRDIFAQ